MKRLIVPAIAILCAALAAVVVPRTELVASDAPVSVPAGFEIETIAHVSGPRELAVAANGDLFVGTRGNTIQIVAGATGTPAKPAAFATLPDRVAAGVTLASGALYVGSVNGVWRIPYTTGDRTASAAPKEIALVRAGGGRGHETTSVAVAGDRLYASVGSSCNVCDETDPTRATIQEMTLDGREMHARATHIRNAIALAVDPRTQALWAGVAGQDELEHGHPYEIFDAVTAHAGTPNYGWPVCFEDRRPVDGKRDCSAQAVPRVAFPAYETPIGAAFYHVPAGAAHAFPAPYRDGAFVALHGSWHTPPVPPRVVFVPIDHDTPAIAVDWKDPSRQWRPFVDGFQRADGSRAGRPTGVAVASDGSLFVADDDANAIYRIRPAALHRP
ncbi:MAG: sorbosone dehydrogenase family protein [Vulcanimicrobiaceae bacterium]